MPVGLYMDVHVPIPITFQLRMKGVDVLTAQEDGATELDIRFKALAEQW